MSTSLTKTDSATQLDKTSLAEQNVGITPSKSRHAAKEFQPTRPNVRGSADLKSKSATAVPSLPSTSRNMSYKFLPAQHHCKKPIHLMHVRQGLQIRAHL